MSGLIYGMVVEAYEVMFLYLFKFEVALLRISSFGAPYDMSNNACYTSLLHVTINMLLTNTTTVFCNSKYS